METIRELTIKKLDSVQDIPVLPTSIYQVLDIANDPKASAQDLSKILEKDQALTTKVLKMANSSYYGFVNTISTISHAIVCLGLNTIVSIVLTAEAFELLQKSNSAYGLREGELYLHCTLVAHTAKIVAKRAHYHNAEEAYVAGLLHDIGKLMMNLFWRDKFQMIVSLAKKENMSFLDAEKKILGIDHAEIGFLLAEKWNLPEILCTAIRWHHEPNNAKQHCALVNIIHISDAVADMMGISLGVDGLNYSISEKALADLNLVESDIEHIIADVSDVIKTENLLPSKD